MRRNFRIRPRWGGYTAKMLYNRLGADYTSKSLQRQNAMNQPNPPKKLLDQYLDAIVLARIGSSPRHPLITAIGSNRATLPPIPGQGM